VSPTGIKTPEWVQPTSGNLDKQHMNAAMKELVAEYPRIVRSMTDTQITNQSVGLVSLNLFRKPHTTRRGYPVYGFFKVRGNYADENMATKHASDIIRKQDSKFKIHLAPVGHWLPITEDPTFTKDQYDVRMNEEEKHLRDQAAKEKEEEENRIKKELRERENELKTDDPYEDPYCLKYYSIRRVSEMRVTEEIERYKKHLEKMKENLTKVRRELKAIERKHPEHKDNWVACWNVERVKSGIPPFVPSTNQFRDYSHHNVPEEELHKQDKEFEQIIADNS
jgi:hypothetical protein